MTSKTDFTLDPGVLSSAKTLFLRLPTLIFSNRASLISVGAYLHYFKYLFFFYFQIHSTVHEFSRNSAFVNCAPANMSSIVSVYEQKIRRQNVKSSVKFYVTQYGHRFLCDTLQQIRMTTVIVLSFIRTLSLRRL